jgi:hypothetical protein
MWGLGDVLDSPTVLSPHGSTERVPCRMTLTRGHVRMFAKWSQIQFAGYVGSTCELVLDCVDALHV